MTAPTSRRPDIPGYTFGSPEAADSPVTDEELRELEQTVGWSGEDADLLLKHANLFEAHAEEMVNSWRAEIGAHPQLAKWFFGPDRKPDERYKARVKRRFVQWVVDAATRPHDRAWLDYQEEIGLRHTPRKKNATDKSRTPSLVPLRFLLAFVPIVTPIAKFFEQGIADRAELAAIERAWTKAVHLHVTLWARPYAEPQLW
jgi:Protoglobin